MNQPPARPAQCGGGGGGCDATSDSVTHRQREGADLLALSPACLTLSALISTSLSTLVTLESSLESFSSLILFFLRILTTFFADV